MPAPLPRPPSARPVPRRALLLGSAALLLAGCGPVLVGSPEEYTPPPPGIDDLYREDLLTLLDRAVAGTAAVLAAAGGAPAEDPELSAALGVLESALPQQRLALLTGAEAEKEQEAKSDPDPEATTTPAPTDVPQDLPALVTLLGALRDLAVQASVQISGSLARPVAALAAHTEWIATRLDGAAGTSSLTAVPVAADLVATREVPASDPPSIGAESDYRSSLQRAQQEEWYAGYAHEVLAARAEGTAREQHQVLSQRHRDRAAALAAIAEEDGAPVVARQAVYALPAEIPDEQLEGVLPGLLARGLLGDHLALVGAAPFARRALSVVAALEEAQSLAAIVSTLAPLPSLETEDLPPAD
ncbi:DUF4439 domain-containing protein [Brachybacterium sp. J144]|uniref:DUF4439 domain-containing protein n=1 Tax=Brachybacterium sp. J144 TaxID=3116487 RepID=UPI002E786215|nr:DUF4439 domain-containing protein [Brachybacterium sp. J144]MEE1649180.1 DUF4439 domain-containing protein [Brachybacterium sp. J144]